MMYFAETSFSGVYRPTVERGILPLKFYDFTTNHHHIEVPENIKCLPGILFSNIIFKNIQCVTGM